MSQDGTREAWDEASRKHEREYDDMLAQAADPRLVDIERQVLEPLLPGARVVHPLSGNGLDDAALLALGAREVIGVDYTLRAAASTNRRAIELGINARYVCAAVPPTPLADGCADLLYTGQGALIWMSDLGAWAADMARLVRAGGHLFIYEAHPLVPLWTLDPDAIGVRADRSYFAPTHINDTFPAGGAVEHQHTLAQIVMAVQGAGFTLEHLAEHPEPFWKPGEVEAAAWDGRVPNTYSLLARRT